MIVVEIHSPVFDEEAGSEQLRWRATVKAKRHGGIEIQGERELVAGGELPVRDWRTGERLLAADDPENWVRSLPQAFRAGDLVVEIVYDDSTPEETPVPEGPERAPQTPPSVPGSLTSLALRANC
jgi:hypothetical protein